MEETKKIQAATAYGVCGNMWDNSNDGYDQFLQSIRDRFKRCTQGYADVIYTTDAAGLWELFLRNLPIEAQQHYTCNCCRQFVERFGGLVTIEEDGTQHPVMWDDDAVSDFFKPAVAAMFEQVRKANVNGVFYTSSNMGTPVTGPWSHMAVDTPARIRFKREADAMEKMATMREDHNLFAKTLAKYDQKTIEAALNLLQTGALAQGSNHVGKMEWFLKCKKDVSRNGVNRKNLIWRYSALAPTGMCHVANSVLGALMDNIASGMNSSEVELQWNKMVDPKFYQRPQAAPTSGAVLAAEKKVAELGVQNSLKRRYAKLEEVQTIWNPTPEPEKTADGKPGGVFGNVITKDKKDDRPILPSQAITITWEKFRREVMPKAIKMWANVQRRDASFAAFLTAADMDAPPILKYDMPEKRNPMSWYIYPNGSPAEHWGTRANIDIPVTGISLLPPMWGDENAYPTLGRGAMFLLEGVSDHTGSSGMGLFPVLMKSELYGIRSVLEAYSKQNQPEGSDEATACGLLLTESHPTIGAKIRVMTDVGEAYYVIDRWD